MVSEVSISNLFILSAMTPYWTIFDLRERGEGQGGRGRGEEVQPEQGSNNTVSELRKIKK